MRILRRAATVLAVRRRRRSGDSRRPLLISAGGIGAALLRRLGTAVRRPEPLPAAPPPAAPAGPDGDLSIDAIVASVVPATARTRPGDGEMRRAGPGRPLPSPLAFTVPAGAIRAMTPRAMAELSLELYLRGLLNQDEYRMLAFQPDLHPGFTRTIGALTSRAAQPDRPRDFVTVWQERLAFESSHGPVDSVRLRRTRAVLDVLQRLDRRPDCRPAAVDRVAGEAAQSLAESLAESLAAVR